MQKHMKENKIREGSNVFTYKNQVIKKEETEKMIVENQRLIEEQFMKQTQSALPTRDSSMQKECTGYERVEGLKRRIIDVAGRMPKFPHKEVQEMCAKRIRGKDGLTMPCDIRQPWHPKVAQAVPFAQVTDRKEVSLSTYLKQFGY